MKVIYEAKDSKERIKRTSGEWNRQIFWCEEFGVRHIGCWLPAMSIRVEKGEISKKDFLF